MRSLPLLALLFLSCWATAYAQESPRVTPEVQDILHVGMDYFFQNGEYEYSSCLLPHTIGGVWVHAGGQVGWGAYHSLHGGLHLLKLQGTRPFIDKAKLSGYYQFQTPYLRFRVGAMPLKSVTGDYSDYFIRDSVYFHDPMMMGLSLQLTDLKHLQGHIWLDWVSQATATQRESFQAGLELSARKGGLYATSQSRLFHLAGHSPRNYEVSVVEHIMSELRIGAQWKLGWKDLALDGSVGVLVALERDRLKKLTYCPWGFTAMLQAEVAGIRSTHQLYLGQPHFQMYDTYTHQLYWGNPFLRRRSYLQSAWQIELIRTPGVALALEAKLHFSEGHLFSQQGLTASIQLSPQLLRSSKKRPLGEILPWWNLF